MDFKAVLYPKRFQCFLDISKFMPVWTFSLEFFGLATIRLHNDGEAVATLTKIKWDSAEKAQEAPENHTMGPEREAFDTGNALLPNGMP